MEIPIKIRRKIEDWFGFTLPSNLPRLTNDYKDCRFSDGQRRNKKDYALCRSGTGIKAYNWKNGVDKQKFFSLPDHEIIEPAPKRKYQPVKPCDIEFNKLSKTIPTDHGYLLKKKIKVEGLNIRYSKGDLYIPIYSPKRQIISWQMISEGCGKWFKPGHKLPPGHCFPIGKDTKGKIYLCEGFATGVTIHQSTDKRVYCSFSKGNLDNLGRILLKKFPKQTIVMCLDNDEDKTHKTEIEDKRLEVLIPDLPGDFNDPQNVNDKEKNKLINGIVEIAKEAKQMKTFFNKLGFKVRYNIRSNKHEIFGFEKEQKWQEITDEIRSSVYLWVRELSPKMTKTSFEDRLKALSHSCKEDPFLTWLKKRKWDGTERLKTFLSECFEIEGAGNKALAEWAFKSILLGAVTRTFQPGSKLDEFCIFKSPQGLGKSSLFFNLLENPDHFTNSVSFSSHNKEIIENIQGKVIAEFSELSGFLKADVEKLKNLLSTQIDNVRLSYRRDSVSYPRRCVFVGSTNDLKPLPSDLTGMRRFCVIVLEKKIDFSEIIKKVKQVRNQLWAEAVKCYKAGESARLPENLWKVSAEVAEQHRSGDQVFEDNFLEMIAGKSEIILKDVLKEMKDGKGEGQDKTGGGFITNMSVFIQSQAKELLTKAGYKEKRRNKNGVSQRYWVNKNVEEQNTNDLHKQTYGKEREPEDLKVIHPHPFG